MSFTVGQKVTLHIPEGWHGAGDHPAIVTKIHGDYVTVNWRPDPVTHAAYYAAVARLISKKSANHMKFYGSNFASLHGAGLTPIQ
jgi:hypothetical protein